jgi:hypothetical protein
VRERRQMSGWIGLGLAAVVAFAATSAASRIPATDTFRDGYSSDGSGNFMAWTDRIRSDAPGPGIVTPYQNGAVCVDTWVGGNEFFLRTIGPNCSPATRALTVDFTDPVSLAPGIDCSSGSYLVTDAYGIPGALNVCGSNAVPDARVIAANMWERASGNGTSVTLVLNLAPDFQHNEFELDFEQNLPITVLSPTARVLTGSSLTIADLYRYGANGKKTLLGQYRMPFQVTVQE